MNGTLKWVHDEVSWTSFSIGQFQVACQKMEKFRKSRVLGHWYELQAVAFSGGLLRLPYIFHWFLVMIPRNPSSLLLWQCNLLKGIAIWSGAGNQITVVAFQPVQLAQASFLQKNQMLQNVLLISVTLRWHKASVARKNQSF